MCAIIPARPFPSPLTLGPQVFDGNLDRITVTVSTFGPRWSSESRYGWNRADRTRTDAIYGVHDPVKPESQFGGRRLTAIAVSGLGISSGGEINALANAPSWSLEQKMNYNIGRHSLKFGGMFYREKAGRANVRSEERRVGKECRL